MDFLKYMWTEDDGLFTFPKTREKSYLLILGLMVKNQNALIACFLVFSGQK